MNEQDPELEAFSKFIVAIEPWLGEVVLENLPPQTEFQEVH
jgi:hypothetical protein